MRVLIVGCGYVGLPLGGELVRQGCEVFGLRRKPESSAEFAAAGIKPLFGDIAQPASLNQLPAVYDWVVNCVSASGGGVDAYRSTYLEGTRHLLQWFAAYPPKRFVYTSSTSVYAQNDGALVDETSPAEPIAPTAQILAETERALLDAFRQTEFPATVMRVAGIYGRGRGYWLKQYLGAEAVMTGDGRRFINMIHRDDVVGCVIAVLQKGKAGQIYNAVDDEPVSQRTLFEWLAERTGHGLPPSVPDEPDARSRRGVTNKRVSNQKLKTELQYQFKYPSFREGFDELIRENVKRGT